MNHDRQTKLARQVELGDQGQALAAGRREVVVVVEPDLADGDASRVAGQFAELGERVAVELGGVMRMNAGRGPQRAAMAVGQRQTCAARLGRVADGHDALDAGFGRAFENQVQIEILLQ